MFGSSCSSCEGCLRAVVCRLGTQRGDEGTITTSRWHSEVQVVGILKEKINSSLACERGKPRFRAAPFRSGRAKFQMVL